MKNGEMNLPVFASTARSVQTFALFVSAGAANIDVLVSSTEALSHRKIWISHTSATRGIRPPQATIATSRAAPGFAPPWPPSEKRR